MLNFRRRHYVPNMETLLASPRTLCLERSGGLLTIQLQGLLHDAVRREERLSQRKAEHGCRLFLCALDGYLLGRELTRASFEHDAQDVRPLAIFFS